MKHAIQKFSHLPIRYCVRCEGIEDANLTSDCPNCLMTQHEMEQVSDGELDFKNGKWEKL